MPVFTNNSVSQSIPIQNNKSLNIGKVGGGAGGAEQTLRLEDMSVSYDFAKDAEESALDAMGRRESLDSQISGDDGRPMAKIEESAAFSPMSLTSDLSSSANGNTGPESADSSSSSVKPAAAVKKRSKKKKRLTETLSASTFKDMYYLTGDVLGEGSYGRVETCINMFTDVEYAVKIISKQNWCFSRLKVLKEIELYYLCQGQDTIIQLIEYFEEQDGFYLIFEKAFGGPLLDQIQKRVHFTEREAAAIIRDLAKALKFLHERGIAHRDIKPENILCLRANSPYPVKLCDFDLCSGVHQTVSTPMLQSPVGSAEYMAPEVVNAFNGTDDDYYYSYTSHNMSPGESEESESDEDELTYDKKCDLWSLGVIAYILLCGYLPFAASGCDREMCHWERGGDCAKCQRSLFETIKAGKLVFPEKHWNKISDDAKDLIRKLLVKNAANRINAASVLTHPWIESGGESVQATSNLLETPVMLRRQTSEANIKDEDAAATEPVLNRLQSMDAGKLTYEPSNPTFSLVFNRMIKSQTSQNLEQKQKLHQRKISAQVCGGGNFRRSNRPGMRRQTSLIMPEEYSAVISAHLREELHRSGPEPRKSNGGDRSRMFEIGPSRVR